MFSCKDSQSPTASVDTSVIIPLKVGNMWIYKTTSWSVRANSDSTFYSDTTRVNSQMVINNAVWFLVTTTTGVDTSKRQNRSDGLWGFDSLQGPELIIKYPANINDTYGEYTVVTTDTAIDVSAGRFNCYVYKRINSNSETKLFFAPGIGLIKEIILVTSAYSDNIYLLWELNSYSLR